MCPGAAAATGFHTGEGGLSSTRPFASDNQQAVDDENQGARATEGARWPAGMRYAHYGLDLEGWRESGCKVARIKRVSEFASN
jgi:hypothetical protein